MPNVVVQDVIAKPAFSPILDRFRELLRGRDEEFRASFYDGVVPPLTTPEIVRMYEDVLSELSFNSKPIITDLTIIAGEQRAHAEGIADAISARILEVPVEEKLPSLYLLDSIVKNIGREYIRYFSTHLPEVFSEAYKQAPPDMHTSMQHLFRTWSSVIEVKLQFPPSLKQPSSGLTNAITSQSSRPLHGIHVNPKYLEGRGQIDSESACSNVKNDIHKIYAQKPIVGYDDYKSDRGEGALPSIAVRKLNSSGYGNCTLVPCESEKLLSSVGDPARVARGNGEALDWKKRNEVERIDIYNQNNGHKRDRTRALIDAYGQDNGQRTIDEHPHKFGSRVIDGIDGKIVARPWQHTEEEEFDWEDMSSSLGTDTISSGRLRVRCGVDPLIAGSSTLILRKSWPGDTRMSSADDSSKIAEVVAPSFDEFVHKPDPVNPQGVWKLSERTAPLTFPGSIVSSSASARLAPHVNRHPDSDLQVGGFPLQSDSLNTSALPAHQQLPSGLRPPTNFHNPKLPPFGSNYPPQTLNNKVKNQGPQQFNGGGIKNFGTANAQPHLPTPLPGLVHPPVPFCPQEPWQGRPLPPAYGVVAPGKPMMNPIPPMHPFDHSPHISGSSFQQGTMLPFPSGPPPVHPQIVPFRHNSIPTANPSFGIADSGLTNSLFAQGVISLTNQSPVQDSVGVEFNLDILKVRHESAIRGLYADLPRQCTTCALRFKTQEEHSKHMDWHVTKNRISKNRKQNPSRKWFVSMTMWLSGAEALGTGSAPNFFLPTDTAEEKQDEEFAVPADDDQKTCALCGEPFEDFYSDETDEWMYKGAVYLNAPGRSTAGLDLSLIGPIVHAKCRPESDDAPA
ncbi:hypothetical protein V2J09_021005 [Rumex salicifolius]